MTTDTQHHALTARLAQLPFRLPLLAATPITLCIAIMGLPDLGHERPLLFRTLFLCTYLAWVAPTAWLQRLLWRRGLSGWAVAAGMLGATYAMSVVNSVLGEALGMYLGLHREMRWHTILRGLDGCWLPLIAFCAAHAVVAFHVALVGERARAADAALLLRDAELRALRYQVQPHFLFNTLNAVSALVAGQRNGDANRMIAQLAELLRATLSTQHVHEHALADELSLTETYLEIEKARLGERLRLTIDVGPGILDALVPSLLLQPLVENAVRHGIAPRTAGGMLSLHAHADGGKLRLRIVNDCDEGDCEDGKAAPAGSFHLGLANVAQRLDKLYGAAQRFTAGPDGTNRFVVAIELPLRAAGAGSAATTWMRAA